MTIKAFVHASSIIEYRIDWLRNSTCAIPCSSGVSGDLHSEDDEVGYLTRRIWQETEAAKAASDERARDANYALAIC